MSRRDQASREALARVQGWPAARDSEGVEAGRPASELEIVSRAMSTASARSIASFNSEEGFGSPQMHRRPAKRKGVPDVATEHFEVPPQPGVLAGLAGVVVTLEFEPNLDPMAGLGWCPSGG